MRVEKLREKIELIADDVLYDDYNNKFVLTDDCIDYIAEYREDAFNQINSRVEADLSSDIRFILINIHNKSSETIKDNYIAEVKISDVMKKELNCKYLYTTEDLLCDLSMNDELVRVCIQDSILSKQNASLFRSDYYASDDDFLLINKENYLIEPKKHIEEARYNLCADKQDIYTKAELLNMLDEGSIDNLDEALKGVQK